MPIQYGPATWAKVSCLGRTSVQCHRILRAARQGRARRVSAERFPACSTGPRISRANVYTLFGIHPVRVPQDSAKNARECEAIRAHIEITEALLSRCPRVTAWPPSRV